MSMRTQVERGGPSTVGSHIDFKDQKMDIRSIMKDIESLGSAHMTWKERKELENKKVVSLGGKPPKQQRLPLSVARVVMKKQKERDQKMLEERMILGRFGAKFTSSDTKKTTDKRRRPEDKVLKATEGRFRNGVLDVKHMLQSGARKEPREKATPSFTFNEERKKKGPKKSKGKRKGGGKKRH